MARCYWMSIVTAISLTGCVNYAGVHDHAVPLNDAMLTSNDSSEWWTRFNDKTLNKLITTALADSPTMKIAESRIEEAAHLANESESALWPSIDANAQIAREKISQTTFFPPPYAGNTYTETLVGLNFKYEFDFWGKNREDLAAKISAKRAEEADYAEAALVLGSAVANQYLELQYSAAALKISLALSHQRLSMYNIVKSRASHGVESDIPLSTAEAQLQAANLHVITAKERITLVEHQLAVLMGQNPLTAHFVAQPFRYTQKIATLPAVIHANILGCRPDIVASRLRIEVTAHKVNIAKSRFYPNINLLGLLSLQSYTLSKAFSLSSQDNSLQAAIDLPIFDAGARRANLAIQYDEYDRARDQYNETILIALREVADQASTMHSLHNQIAAQKSALRASEARYHLTRARYRHGIADYMSVLETEGPYLEEQNTQIQLETNHLKATVALIKALGGHYPQEG